MSSPYIGEIRMFGGSFAPAGWAMCQGQLMAISQNDALFTLIGTTYGGNGSTTFALPNLAGRATVHTGTGTGQTYSMGQQAGVESVTLTTQQIPTHTHSLTASQDLSNTTSPNNAVLAQTTQILMYTEDSVSKAMPSNTLSIAGGSQPHENMQPYLVVTFIISLSGIFPSQN